MENQEFLSKYINLLYQNITLDELIYLKRVVIDEIKKRKLSNRLHKYYVNRTNGKVKIRYNKKSNINSINNNENNTYSNSVKKREELPTKD